MTAAPQALEGTEREAYVSWLADTYPSSWSREAAEHNWQHNHISALAWQARAALAAPAPQAAPVNLLDFDSSATDEGCAALYRAHGITKEPTNDR